MKTNNLEEEQKQAIIKLLEETINKIKNNNLQNCGISVSEFCKKYKNIMVSSTNALKWLDKFEYTKLLEKDNRVVTKKGEKFLNQEITIRININSGKFYIQQYPLIPLEQEKFFAKMFNKDNFS